jgi:hypothetical protein
MNSKGQARDPAATERFVPMKDKPLAPDNFSTNLFWDIDPETFNVEQHIKYVISRVLESGTLEDWRLLCHRFTLSAIIETAQTLRSIDPKALAFLSVVGHVPRETFRCCTSRPSTATHWIY